MSQGSSAAIRKPNSIITARMGALVTSGYQQCMLSLACRILSDPCELDPVMTFNGKHQQGTSISSLATFCYWYQSPRLSFLFAQKHIILTLFRLNSTEDLGGRTWKKGVHLLELCALLMHFFLSSNMTAFSLGGYRTHLLCFRTEWAAYIKQAFRQREETVEDGGGWM